MVGSLIVKNAFIVARQRSRGINLGLSRINVEIWWQVLVKWTPSFCKNISVALISG
jgi:hypothetical protein